MRKKILSLILVFALIFTLAVPSANSATIVQTSMTVDMTGACKLIGYVSGGAGCEVTFLMWYGSNPSTKANWIYVDQVTAGNNGTFLFQFQIDAKWSEKTVNYAIGSDSGAASLKKTYTLPYLPPGFEHITNNSVIYGHDAYTTDSIYLSDPVTVTDSIIHGGNVIYFKIGDKWYDLLNSNATSSNFFTASNATADDTVKKATSPLRYYYYKSRKCEFAK